MPEAPAAEAVAISFEDRADGAVVVRTEDGAERAVLAPGTNGFIRGVLRGLARERRMNGKGADTPFHLVLRVDGRLALADPATGRTLDLGAFGHTNADAFARLLRPE
jgi:putative photosynthetic complex assembly protein